MQTLESPFANIAGVECLLATHAQAVYGRDTVTSRIRLAGALIVRSSAAVPQIIQRANDRQLPLWPISCGRNFGYGSAVPAMSGCYVVDLSELRGITWNGRAGAVTVEPGVTLADLHKYLATQKLDYLVPVTGAGGQGSLIGNALDGGFNVTPLGDHFQAITHAQGFWGSGAPFSTLLDQLDCEAVGQGWRHGLGPSILGLLRQGRFGLVTKATIRLRPRPEASCLMELRWRSPEAFLAAQGELGRLLDDVPAISGFTSIQGMLPVDREAGQPGANLPWLCVAPAFGSRESVTSAGYTLQRRLRGVKVLVHSADDLQRLSRWRTKAPAFLRLLQAIPGTGVSNNSAKLAGFEKLLAGTPHYDPLLQAVIPEQLFNKVANSNLIGDPDTGLLWYAGLLLATELSTTKFVSMARRALLRNGQNAALMLTMVDPRTIVARVPLIFDKADSINAKECIKDLVSSGLKLEIPPQRMGATGWGTLLDANADQPQWASLQKALDPNRILLPLRGASS